MHDGVADQIANNAFQQHGVRPDGGRAGAHPQAYPFLAGLGGVLGPQLVQQRPDAERLKAGVDDASVQPRQVQQGVEQMPHRGHRACDVVQQVAPMPRQRLVRQQAQEQIHGMHGLAQVVAGRRQEPGLFQIAAFGRGLFLAHLVQQRQVLIAQPQCAQMGAVHAMDKGQGRHQIREPARHQRQMDGGRLRRQRNEHRRESRNFERVHHGQHHVIRVDRARAQPEQNDDEEQLVFQRDDKRPVSERQSPQNPRTQVAGQHAAHPAPGCRRIVAAAVVRDHGGQPQAANHQRRGDPQQYFVPGQHVEQREDRKAGGDQRSRQREGKAPAQRVDLHLADAGGVGRAWGREGGRGADRGLHYEGMLGREASKRQKSGSTRPRILDALRVNLAVGPKTALFA
ncbi:hypothetical protein D3C72_1267120 [compost metagenome]